MKNVAVMDSSNWNFNCQMSLFMIAVIVFLKFQLSLSMTATFDVFNIGIMSKLLLLFLTLKLI